MVKPLGETARAEVEIGAVCVFSSILDVDIFRNQRVLGSDRGDLSKP